MKFLFSLVTLLVVFSGFNQVVDDSTKNVYGPKSTSVILENQLLNNDGDYVTLDTSIYLFERQSEVDISVRKFQDLGVLGTALFPIFYTPSTTFGRTSGYQAYLPYAFQPSEVKYYDTKSPFIDLFVLLGGGNRNIVDVGFSRNVNKNWNLGFDFRRITVDKQLANNGRGDRQVEGSTFVGYTHYKHDKLPYQLMFHYSQMNHNAVEMGGVRYPNADSLQSDLFDFDNALLRLEEAQTNSKERRIHLYHDFRLTDEFQLYHLLDRRTEENTFKDFTDRRTGSGYDTYADFYPNFFVDEDSTYQRSRFTSFTNEAGFKGELASIFYRTYVKVRNVDFNYNYLDPKVGNLEKYVGGYARFDWKEQFAITGNGEYLAGGEYTLGGTIANNTFNASYQTTKYKVPFIYQRYFGNNHDWSNSFDPLFTNQLKASFKFNWKSSEIIPKIVLTSFQNFVYFDQQRQPQQNTDLLLLSGIGADLNIRILNEKGEGWHLENEGLFSTVTGSGPNVIRVPELYYNGRFFWRGNAFEDKVPFEIGFDTHAR
ncbi:MAG: hypothetical protein OXH57_10010, partial [Ekhidna sp.]|nr:hypothetical protein [Ekhidna sp.]